MKKTNPKKSGNSKGTAMLKRIITEAQKIHKASPKKKWQNCIKDASKKVKK